MAVIPPYSLGPVSRHCSHKHLRSVLVRILLVGVAHGWAVVACISVPSYRCLSGLDGQLSHASPTPSGLPTGNNDIRKSAVRSFPHVSVLLVRHNTHAVVGGLDPSLSISSTYAVSSLPVFNSFGLSFTQRSQASPTRHRPILLVGILSSDRYRGPPMRS
jgi:hypothetical protein